MPCVVIILDSSRRNPHTMTINAVNDNELYLGPYHCFSYVSSFTPFQCTISIHTCILCLYLEESLPWPAFVGDHFFGLFFCINFLCVYIYIHRKLNTCFYSIFHPPRIMGSQNWWFGDARTLRKTESKPSFSEGPFPTDPIFFTRSVA